MSSSNPKSVGVIGLGIMGGAYAKHLLAAGFRVVGFDLSEASLERFVAAGGTRAESPTAVAKAAEAVLIALPSEAALRDACMGADGLLAGCSRSSVFIELGTLPGAVKAECRDAAAKQGAAFLDCPVSGTGAQAARGDLDIFASGEDEAIDRVSDVLAAFSKNVYRVGEFGAGMKMKLIANLLVTVHNLAAAEALTLARQAGLDLGQVHQALRTGAGTSRMFEVRGPLMVEGSYQPATARFDVHMKDIRLITAFADSVNSPTPLFSASIPLYLAALAQGRVQDDTAALFEVLKTLASPPAKG